MSSLSPSVLAERGSVRAVFAGPIRLLHSARVPAGPVTAWRSAILKSAQLHAIMVGPLGLHGDAQKEKKHHGGPMKAVLVYGAAHYEQWSMSLAPHAVAHAAALRQMSPDIDASRYGFGAFGENLTVDGLTEANVCLGDSWAIGDCVLRISEPRGPCATLTRRWMRPQLLGDVKRNAASGWYNAVLQPGMVAAGDEARLVERVQQAWTMERVFHLLERRVASRADLMALHDAPCTHDALRARLARRLATPSRCTK